MVDPGDTFFLEVAWVILTRGQLRSGALDQLCPNSWEELLTQIQGFLLPEVLVTQALAEA